MLSLYIGSVKIQIKDASGLTFKVLPLHYKEDGALKELRLSTSLPLLNDVKIYFQWWRFFIHMPLSAELKITILNFMLFKHLVEDISFDCYSFVCWYARVPQHDKSHLREYWRFNPFRWLNLKVGDVVFFFSSPIKKHIRFSHACIYLGFGRYLSVWGGGGQFEVTTFSDMKKDFESKKVYIVTPR